MPKDGPWQFSAAPRTWCSISLWVSLASTENNQATAPAELANKSQRSSADHLWHLWLSPCACHKAQLRLISDVVEHTWFSSRCSAVTETPAGFREVVWVWFSSAPPDTQVHSLNWFPAVSNFSGSSLEPGFPQKNKGRHLWNRVLSQEMKSVLLEICLPSD